MDVAPAHHRAGTIVFDGVALETVRPEQVVARGIVQAPEGRLIFGRIGRKQRRRR